MSAVRQATIDLGTSRVAAAIVEASESGALEVVGYAEAPSRGLRGGVVVNVPETVAAIRRAADAAEAMAGSRMDAVHVSVPTCFGRIVESYGVAIVRGSEVRARDLAEVHASALAGAVPPGEELLHSYLKEFRIDGQEGIATPIGMTGSRIDATAHFVTAAAGPAQNLVRCVQRAGLQVAGLALSPIAAGASVLTEDEREMGVCLVDIGASSTGVSIFAGGTLRHVSAVSLGGDHLTEDVARGLRTPLCDAEQLKRQFGAARAEFAEDDERVLVPSLGDGMARPMARRILCELLEHRCDEIFSLVNRELERIGIDPAAGSGVVLTGGGALLPGIEIVAEERLQAPIRIGAPLCLAGPDEVVRNPRASTALGLALQSQIFGGLPSARPQPTRWRGIIDWFGRAF